ncbi:MAG: gluconokinase [Imperialibacter sp.]|uniref:gluconokinase n=1 Tax=Imperialibacter sp. TaxID=2038411 RepID=UPI003A8BFCDB
MQYLIGLDIGTTSTKAVAFGVDGRQLKVVNNNYPLISPQEGWFEQDPGQIVNASEAALKTLVEQLGEKPMAVSISSAMHGLMLIGKNGEPITNLIIWADNRSDKEARQLKASKEGAAIYFASGTPIHPMSPLCKMLWLQKNRPDLMQRAEKFVSIKEYIIHRWTGEYLLDQSLASATGLYNNEQTKWNDLALQVAGIKGSQLPAVLPTTTILPKLKAGIAQQLGVEVDTPVIIGASDGCLANLGSGVLDTTTASLTIGTSSAYRKTIDKFVRDEKQSVFNYILTSDLYVVGGPSNNGGVVAQWFEKEFGDGEFDEQALRSVRPGSDGLIFLPYLLGERAPIWDPESKGVFFGVQMNHTKNHFYKAVWEGVFQAAHHIAETVDQVTGEVEKVVVSGGFAKSDYLIQTLSNVLQKPCWLCNSAESSAFGAAILGMHAIGELKDLKDASKLVHFEKEFLPDPSEAEVYRNSLEKSKRIYGRLKDEFN